MKKEKEMADRSASLPDIKAVGAAKERYDVAILGGGLAGLTLALHLKRTRPETSVLVAEKRAEPAPEAAFKVGESSVEVGAYYYREICGLADHLEEVHIRKAGLRFFMPAGDNSDITRRVEFATPLDEDVYTHQIDRGVYENEIFDRCVAGGVDAFRGYRVQDVEIGSDEGEHKVTVEHAGGTSTVAARWVVDCTGRSNLLRNKLDLADETGHVMNAAWFRLAGGIDIESWTDDEEWLGRMPERGTRSRSTIHLVDEGYWVWLINLGTGPISVGVVADPRFHPFEQINEYDRMVAWLKDHEPQLAAEVEGRRHDVQDFLVIENFSYKSKQIVDADRWCLTGESAAFIDALYSPGSDFIAYANTFANDLITRDLDGEDIEERLEFFNFMFFELFNPYVYLYKDQYQFFGNTQVMLGKQLFDNNIYFSTLAFVFLHDKLTDLDDLPEILEQLQPFIDLGGRMQEFFRDWHALGEQQYEGVSVLNNEFQPMQDRVEELVKPFEHDAMVEHLAETAKVQQAIAVWLFHKAAKQLPDPPGEDVAIDPLAISLKPDKWEEDGLFSDDGMTLAQALELLPGIEEYSLEDRAKLATA
jgi:flavin-dependent dehydrogenase